MPLYAVDIEKRLGSEFWSNRWLVNADTIATGIVFASALMGAERNLHSNTVLFTRFRVSDASTTSDQYTVVPVNLFGDRSAPGSLLPLFNTLRADMPAATGRPSRKYFRGVLGEGDIDGDLVTTDFQGLLDAFALLFADGVANVSGVVDPQGQFLTTISQGQFVQMRQLRRSRRRRTNGGGIFQ